MSDYAQNTPKMEANTSWAKIFHYIADGATVLDVGCSDGQLGKALKAQKDCTVYGIEIDPGDLAIAQKVLDGVFGINIETEDLPPALARLKFDAIVLADVVEHFVNPSRALQLLKKLLKKDGRIVFSIPNMSHISVRLQLLSGRLIYNNIGLLDHTHLHFYDYEEVKRVMTNAGLTIKAIDANTLAYPPSFLEQKLADLGLKDAGYIKATQNDKHAQSFQFVGYAAAAAKSIGQIPLSTTTPEHELTEYIEELKKANRYLNDRVKNLEAENESLTGQAKLTQEHLDTIMRSPIWQASHKARQVYQKLRTRKP
jgi:methionine biosynthesis protein MetW